MSLLASAFSLRSLPSPHTTSTAVDTWMPIASIHSINNSRCIQRPCIDDAKLRVIDLRDAAPIASTTALSMASKGDDDAENIDSDEQQNRNIDAKSRKDDRAKDTPTDDQEEENGEEEKKSWRPKSRHLRHG